METVEKTKTCILFEAVQSKRKHADSFVCKWTTPKMHSGNKQQWGHNAIKLRKLGPM